MTDKLNEDDTHALERILHEYYSISFEDYMNGNNSEEYRKNTQVYINSKAYLSKLKLIFIKHAAKDLPRWEYLALEIASEAGYEHLHPEIRKARIEADKYHLSLLSSNNTQSISTAPSSAESPTIGSRANDWLDKNMVKYIVIPLLIGLIVGIGVLYYQKYIL